MATTQQRKPKLAPSSNLGASTIMNEEMGRVFCRTFWEMMDHRKGIEEEIKQLRAELMAAVSELRMLREHCKMRDHQWRYCQDNHEH